MNSCEDSTYADEDSTLEILETIVEDSRHFGQRVDAYIAETSELGSRSQIKLRARELRVNDVPVKPSYKVKQNDRVSVFLNPRQPADVVPERIDFGVLYRDEHVLVVNKPQGLVVHPGAGNHCGTLVNGLAYYLGQSWLDSPGSAERRPGIVHRLDKDTSGVMVVALDASTHGFLVQQFSERTVFKQYVAIVRGNPQRTSGLIDKPISRDKHHRIKFSVRSGRGKPALTEYRCLRQFDGYALVLLTPKTGRTHQLRVHMQSLGLPILGDPLYSRKDERFPQATLLLHALKLAIRPTPDEPPKTFLAPLPSHFRSVLTELHRSSSNSR